MAICTASALGQSDDTARWLVDLGRDYPFTRQSGISDADATLTLLFMQAASRVDAELPSPWYWSTTCSCAGANQRMRQALAAYVKRQPMDAAAQLDWIDLAFSSLQTSEDRAEFCRSYLSLSDLPAVAQSDLHRRLAEYHWNRTESDRAREEVEAAIKADELNIERFSFARSSRRSRDPGQRRRAVARAAR